MPDTATPQPEPALQRLWDAASPRPWVRCDEPQYAGIFSGADGPHIADMSHPNADLVLTLVNGGEAPEPAVGREAHIRSKIAQWGLHCRAVVEDLRDLLALLDAARAERDALRRQLDAQATEIAALRAEHAELLDAYLEDLADSTAQGCQRQDGKLDSACLSTWTANIETLAKYGRVRIIERHGRSLIAEWIPRESGGTGG